MTEEQVAEWESVINFITLKVIKFIDAAPPMHRGSALHKIVLFPRTTHHMLPQELPKDIFDNLLNKLLCSFRVLCNIRIESADCIKKQELFYRAGFRHASLAEAMMLCHSTKVPDFVAGAYVFSDGFVQLIYFS